MYKQLKSQIKLIFRFMDALMLVVLLVKNNECENFSKKFSIWMELGRSVLKAVSSDITFIELDLHTFLCDAPRRRMSTEQNDCWKNRFYILKGTL